MVLKAASPAPAAYRSQTILAQGLIEKAFPAGLDFCIRRVGYQQAENARPPTDAGFAIKRGVFTGSLAEHELHQLGQGKPFTLDIGAAADKLMSRTNFGALDAEQRKQTRTMGIEWVRNRQAFPNNISCST